MTDLIPIFSTDYSIGKSLFTADPHCDAIDNSCPISLATMAKLYQTPRIFVLENTFGSFDKLYQTIGKTGSQLCFGLQIVCCDDVNNKEEASIQTEHKINIWLKNSNSYKDAIRISTKASTDNFYYVPRVDYKMLQEMWTENLLLTVPFYSSFLARNLLRDSLCRPNFGAIKPSFHIEDHDLPTDSLIKDAVMKYATAENCPIINSHRIYYNLNSDFKPYTVFRVICNKQKRGTFNAPKIDQFGSDKFSWESYCEKTGTKLL